MTNSFIDTMLRYGVWTKIARFSRAPCPFWKAEGSNKNVEIEVLLKEMASWSFSLSISSFWNSWTSNYFIIFKINVRNGAKSVPWMPTIYTLVFFSSFSVTYCPITQHNFSRKVTSLAEFANCLFYAYIQFFYNIHFRSRSSILIYVLVYTIFFIRSRNIFV